MAYGLCFLSESGTGKSIAINPHLVRLLMEIDKDKVAVVFDKDLQITVDGTVALISSKSPKSPVVIAACQVGPTAARRRVLLISGGRGIPLAGVS